MWKQRGFFDQRNYPNKSTRKQRGFFGHRNYIEKKRGNNVDFLAIEITSKRIHGNYVDFLTSKITPKTVRGNNLDFPTSEITSKRVCGNDVDFSISEITSKTSVEMTWKLIKIWSLTYRRNIDVESMWIQRGVPVGLLIHGVAEKSNEDTDKLVLLMIYFSFIYFSKTKVIK